MIFEFMRTMVFFDLPVDTEDGRRAYTLFRKWLIRSGYSMLQYSVYVKIFNNRDSAVKHIRKIQVNAPKTGSVRVMLITEKQYSRMEIIVGGRTDQETLVTPDPLLIL